MTDSVYIYIYMFVYYSYILFKCGWYDSVERIIDGSMFTDCWLPLLSADFDYIFSSFFFNHLSIDFWYSASGSCLWRDEPSGGNQHRQRWHHLSCRRCGIFLRAADVRPSQQGLGRPPARRTPPPPLRNTGAVSPTHSQFRFIEIDQRHR